MIRCTFKFQLSVNLKNQIIWIVLHSFVFWKTWFMYDVSYLNYYRFVLLLENLHVHCNGIQYIVSCSTGHEFESKIKLISAKNLCFLRSQRLKWLWYLIYCLFLLLLYLLEREKTRWRKQWKQNQKSRVSVKNIHENKKIWAYSKPSTKQSWQKLEYTLENSHEKKIKTYLKPSEKRSNERKATHTRNK